MADAAKLKRKLGSMFGVGVLATSLAAVPLAYNYDQLTLTTSAAFAKDGDSGEGGDSSGGEGGDNSGPGNSGESGDNSGPGNSGESGDNSGPGNSNSNNSGENSGRGNTNSSGESGGRRKTRRGKRHSTDGAIPARFGRVVRSRSTTRGMEVRYSDGWREKIRDGRYQLTNPRNKVVVSRRARRSDWQRLKNSLR